MWFWPGLIAGAVILGIVLWMRNKGISLKWYEWLLAVIGILLLLFTFENFAGSFAELEQTAAWMFLLVTGLPGTILIILGWQLAMRRHRAT